MGSRIDHSASLRLLEYGIYLDHTPELKRSQMDSIQKRDCAMDSLQNVLTDALTTVGRFTKRNGRFCTGLFMSLFAVCGRANHTNLSRYSPLSERTFRRNFNEGIGLLPTLRPEMGEIRCFGQFP